MCFGSSGVYLNSELPRLGTQADLISTLVERYRASGETPRPKVVFLVGWPISAPLEEGQAGVPGVGELTARAEKWLRDRSLGHDEEGSADPVACYQSAMDAVGKKAGGASAVDELVRGAVLEAHRACRAASIPNATNHNAVRRFCEELEARHEDWVLSPGVEYLGRLTSEFQSFCGGVVLTTNFDPLIEVAIRRHGGSPFKDVVGPSGQLRAGVQSGITSVVHVHGSWSSEARTLHREVVLAKKRPELTRALAKLLKDSTVVVVGYGGWKDVFREALREAATADDSGFELLWSFFTKEELKIEAGLHRLSEMFPRADFYKGVNCHKFFRKLFKKLKRSPSPQTLVAQAEYRRWAHQRHEGLPLIGLGESAKLRFDEVYVPLRITGRFGEMASRDPEEEASAAGRQPDLDDLKIEGIFADAVSRESHRLVVGLPGSGKTTALKNLFRLCLAAKEDEPPLVGLEPGTLPLLIKLSSLAGDKLPLLRQESGDWTSSEAAQRLSSIVVELAGGGFPDAESRLPRLWERGTLLLLLDGLDELPTREDRADLCRLLAAAGPSLPAGTKIVLSCRQEGYSEEQEPLGKGFARLEVAPLNLDQILELVERWFDEAGRASKSEKEWSLNSEELEEHKKDLVGYLKTLPQGEPLHHLVGSPLLLTLLCLSVARGGEIPRRRASFLNGCLRLLLGGWDRSSGQRERPQLDIDLALAVLRRLAGELFRRGETEIETEALIELVRERLAILGSAAEAGKVVRWWATDAMVLETLRARSASESYQFRHLSLQDYLAACDLAASGETAIERFAAQEGSDWARAKRGRKEVLRLLAGLPEHRVFTPLLRGLLKADPHLEEIRIVKSCLLEAFEVEAEAFETALDPTKPPSGRSKEQINERMLRALGLLDWRLPPTLAPWLQRVATEAREKQDHEVEEEAARFLKKLGLEFEPRVDEGRAGDKATPPTLPKMRSIPLRVPRLGRMNYAPTRMRSLPMDASRAVDGQVIEEVATRIRFLPVPAGGFTMGSDEISENERPLRPIQLSAFWLAETATTNRQYGQFLRSQRGSQKVREPFRWRDERFSHPEQPVVAVNWEEAMAFCGWLSQQKTLRSKRLKAILPSEAQWEYVARGGESWRYPWGNEPEPNERLACFGRDWEKDGPEPVGSLAAGTGPFGHADLAGNVWEWCRDPKEDGLYRRLKKAELNPKGWGGSETRFLRGGCWASSDCYLHSDSRRRSPARLRDDGIGFRVALVPLSP